MRNILLIVMATTVSACAQVEFKTNLGDLAVREIRAESVETYTLQEVDNRGAMPLGQVESSYCKTQHDDPFPKESTLIKNMKVQIQQKGGNAIVILECSESKYPQCYRYRECRALAYSIPDLVRS